MKATKFRKLISVIFSIVLISFVITINSILTYAINFDFQKVSESIFVVASDNGYETSFGSGFAIDDTYIITNAHVIIDNYNVEIGTYSKDASNNLGDIKEVSVVAKDDNLDIAVLKGDNVNFPALEIADVDTIKEGNDVYAIGAPEGLSYTLTKGTVSSRLRYDGDRKLIQTDAAINSGNSGGPLLNEDGQVIGMNTMKLSTGENIGFAIRIDEIQSFLDQQGIKLQTSNNKNDSRDSSRQSVESSTAESSKESDDSSALEEESSNIVSESDDEMVVPPSSGATPDNNNGILLAVAIVVIILVVVTVIIILVNKSSNNDIEELLPINDNKSEEDNNNTNKHNVEIKTASGSIMIMTGVMAGSNIIIEDGQYVVVGKDTSRANLILDNSYSKVSRVHCSITYSAKLDKYFVVDTSTNGTYLSNSSRFSKNTRIPLSRGTIIYLADNSCQIKLM